MTTTLSTHADVKAAHQTRDPKHLELSRPIAYGHVVAKLPKYISRAITAFKPSAYHSELLASFKNSFPLLQRPLNVLTIIYLFIDIGSKHYQNAYKISQYKQWFLVDLYLWHLGASIVLPAVAINTYVNVLVGVLTRANFGPRTLKYVPMLTALCLIPFITRPLDQFTDWILDHTFRRYVNYKDYDMSKV
jgi:hypothetical protein